MSKKQVGGLLMLGVLLVTIGYFAPEVFLALGFGALVTAYVALMVYLLTDAELFA